MGHRSWYLQVSVRSSETVRHDGRQQVPKPANTCFLAGLSRLCCRSTGGCSSFMRGLGLIRRCQQRHSHQHHCKEFEGGQVQAGKIMNGLVLSCPAQRMKTRQLHQRLFAPNTPWGLGADAPMSPIPQAQQQNSRVPASPLIWPHPVSSSGSVGSLPRFAFGPLLLRVRAVVHVALPFCF